MRHALALSIVLAACGGASSTPKVAADPARGLRPLTHDSAEVATIAIEAVRSLPPSRGAGQPLFGGVYVNGRLARQASDQVARATGFAPAAGVQKQNVQCVAQTSSGASRPIPCPAQAAASIPPIYRFEEIRATADSAYVGWSETANNSTRGNCITLVRFGGAGWRAMSTAIIADAKNCGK